MGGSPVPRFGDQLPSGAAPRARAAGRVGSAGVAGKVIDLVGTVVQQRKGAPDIPPMPASSTAGGLLGGAAIPVIAAVAGPLASFAFSRIDRSIEVGAVERQQKREMAERAAQTLLSGRRPSSPADEVELCGDDEDGGFHVVKMGFELSDALPDLGVGAGVVIVGTNDAVG